MTTIETATLTPAQFLVARALASAYGHLWSGVPDGTYTIADIEAWSAEHENSVPGINAPYLTQTVNGSRQVQHTTGSGRLQWTIEESGNVRLHIYRPADLSSIRSDTARTFAYAAIQPVEPPDESGILVAAIDVLNGPEGGDREKFSIGEIILGSSDEKMYDEKYSWNYFGPDDGLRDDLLFERHVAALVRPLVALLTANETEPIPDNSVDFATESAAERDARWEREAAIRAEWRQRVIAPAIEKAKEILQPLFEIALPDPWQEPYWPEDLERFPEPATCWIKKEAQDETGAHLLVVHHGKRFPVESEKTAVYAVMMLRHQPEMPLIDAVKAAIVSTNYKP